MVACPIRLQERCEIFIAHVSAEAADQSMDQRVLYVVMEAIQHLGYSTMKPDQLQVVSGIVSGRDVFAVLPTGFGKSLCCACPPTVFGLVLPVNSLVPSPPLPLTKWPRKRWSGIFGPIPWFSPSQIILANQIAAWSRVC